MKRDAQPELYTEQLEALIDRLHQDIVRELGPLSEVKDVRQLDNYILQLNSFYFSSFQENIFPLYRQLIYNDIQSQLNLSMQEETLCQGILGNIKRYAQLYNQVKKLNATLNQGKEKSYQLILANDRWQDHNSIELYTSIRLWREHVQAASDKARQLEEVTRDREFCQALNKTLGSWPVVHFLEQVDLTLPEQSACYTDFLVYLNYCRSLLRQIQKEEKPFIRSSGVFQELEEKTAEFGRRRVPASFLNYRQYLIDMMEGILPNLPLYIKLGELQFYKNALRRLLQQFDDNIILLERSQTFLLNGCREALLQVCQGALETSFDVRQIQSELYHILDSINALEKAFSLPGESDFRNFSQQARERLVEAGNLLGKFRPGQSTTRSESLVAGFYHLDLERHYLLRAIEMMSEDSRRRNELQKVLLQVVNNLDAFINLLSNIRADLERLLAPRNLSRLWKDLDVRVERIPLEIGKLFPGRFLHLLDKKKLDQLPPGSEDIIVTFEEGDLFIIRVGNEQDEEVPYVSIARKERPQ